MPRDTGQRTVCQRRRDQFPVVDHEQVGVAELHHPVVGVQQHRFLHADPRGFLLGQDVRQPIRGLETRQLGVDPDIGDNAADARGWRDAVAGGDHESESRV